MVFSSPIFLFLFLPLFLSSYLLVPRSVRNSILLAASLIFYAWGELYYLLVMLASIGLNHLVGLLLDRSATPRARKVILALGITSNLILFTSFKYVDFMVDNLNILLGAIGWQTIGHPELHLPIGISFFTFQAMSYIVDVYRKKSPVQEQLKNTALYISLFPQLIAGPIVRYPQIAGQLLNRTISVENFALGVRRFTIGLAKKVLIANTLALPADNIFALMPGPIGADLAWLAITCYTFQIYFDFSGYSDMAIGLGKMLGFDIPENFDYPYFSKSVREFWRRWHISLSTWFRDYVYIPLGGSRTTALWTHRNLLVVFFLCGLWHGASWNFVAWGLFHGLFLVLERGWLGSLLRRLPAPLCRVYTLGVIVMAWVFFRAENMTSALVFFRSLLFMDQEGADALPFWDYANVEIVAVLLLALAGSTPLLPLIKRQLGKEGSPFFQPVIRRLLPGGAAFGLVVILVLCCMSLAGGTHNPFIYFRF
ncbi:MAG: MBOAT family protein [Deltaproteobacteria bacterium]|nr:MBOAT family protein [Deltaproteobacteria bacterium]